MTDAAPAFAPTPPAEPARPGFSSAPPADIPAGEVAALCSGALVRGDAASLLRGAAIDSRAVGPGMLFVALAAGRTDGHRFAAEACARGAAAAMVSREMPGGALPPGCAVIRVPDTLRALQRLGRAVRDRLGVRVVGITGSVGKTSTRVLAAAVAARAFRTAQSPGNWNTEIGIPLVLVNLPRDVEVMAAELAQRGPGQIRELAEICRPEIGVVTNVGESHLGFFESREHLAAAKGELIEALPPDGVAVLNAEDPLVLGLRSRGPARVLTFGLARGDVRAEDVRARPAQGAAFRLRTPAGAVEVALPVPGRHAVQNALAAAAAGTALGVPVERIAAALAAAVPLPMRLEIREVGGWILINDAYNSSPQSVEAAFDVMDELPGAPRVAVLGDMLELGASSEDAHRRVGRLAARRRLDLLVAFGPLAADLAAAAREAGVERVVHVATPGDAAAAVLGAVRPGAVVLVKGSRGMAMERIVAVLAAESPAGADGARTPAAGSGAPG